MKPNIEIYNQDCLPEMKSMKDNEFDLAIVDPPYGIDRANNIKTISKHKGRKNSYIKRGDYSGKSWDKSPPDKEYFIELRRVSKNQIIWGANYFIENIEFPNTSCWVVWDKVDTLPTYSDGEMAWTSFDKHLKIVPLIHSGFRRGINIGRGSKIKHNKPFSGAMDIHPTQKPVKLYEWLLYNYAKKGYKILDTHLGSGSIAIACWNLGYDLTGYEIDKEYFDLAMKRLKIHQSQLRMNL